MTSLVRLAITLLSLSCATGDLVGQAQTKNSNQTERAMVTGKVTLKGKPAPGVVVFLRPELTSNPYQNMPRGTTDQTGTYRISDLPPGSYQVNVLSPGYVIADSADARVRMLVLSAGENVEDVNFSIVRGGAITGKVTDSEGRPVIEQQVYAYRVEALNQPQRRGPVLRSAFATTDDRGIYRMFGVAAGQYKIAVGRGDDTFSGGMAIGRVSYLQTYYPNVTDQTKAGVIEVSEASEATNVDISVGPPLQTFSAAGRTVDSENFTPIPNIRFGLQRLRGDQPEFLNTFVSSNSNGDFLAEGLLPGNYRLFLMPEPNSGQRVDAVEFEILDHDVTGLTVKVSKGASISGVLVLENEDQGLQAKLSELQISAYVAGPPGVNRGMGQSASATVGADGTFNLGGLPGGSARFNVYKRLRPDQRWSVSRVERDGAVQAQGLEVREGEQIAGIRVIVAYGNATLRGTVNLINGEPVKGGVFHVRLTKPGVDSPSLRPIQSDARGRFLAEGLPPGVYDIIVSYGVPNIRPRFQKQQVTLSDNATTDVTVTFDLSAETSRP